MPADRKDRLSAIDASFVAQERGPSHMHIGAVMIFDGPPPSREEFLGQIESRLPLVPRYRQKLAFPGFEMGRPLWVDDPRFNIDYHVRHTALPPPGSDEDLRRLVGRIFSQRLDRSKPLWEMWLVQGLEGGRFAVLSKTHHALIDGVSGVDVMTILLDPSPERTASEQPTAASWAPSPEPSQLELAIRLVRDVARVSLEVAGDSLRALRDPLATASSLREAAEGLGEVVRAGWNAPPATPLNTPIGPHRRVLWVKSALADFKLIKNKLGGTINDVVLAVVAGALRRWLEHRGVSCEGLELRVAVPVSIRSAENRQGYGNQIREMLAPLPVGCADPAERLRIVREAMKGVKESKQAVGADVIVALERFAPPTIFAQASRLHFSPRFCNLVVTNVPGPQFPLYLLGRELREVAPVGFLADHFALMVAIISYNGSLTFGLIGDYDAMADLDVLGHEIEESLAEMVRTAGGAKAMAATAGT